MVGNKIVNTSNDITLPLLSVSVLCAICGLFLLLPASNSATITDLMLLKLSDLIVTMPMHMSSSVSCFALFD